MSILKKNNIMENEKFKINQKVLCIKNLRVNEYIEFKIDHIYIINKNDFNDNTIEVGVYWFTFKQKGFQGLNNFYNYFTDKLKIDCPY